MLTCVVEKNRRHGLTMTDPDEWIVILDGKPAERFYVFRAPHPHHFGTIVPLPVEVMPPQSVCDIIKEEVEIAVLVSHNHFWYFDGFRYTLYKVHYEYMQMHRYKTFT